MPSRFSRRWLITACAAASACTDATTAATGTNATVSNNPSCSATLTLSAGQVSAGVTGNTLCVAAGTSAAEYALIPFNGQASSAPAAFHPHSRPEPARPGAADHRSGPRARHSTCLAPAPRQRRLHTPSTATFEQALRLRDRAALTPRIAGARDVGEARCHERCRFRRDSIVGDGRTDPAPQLQLGLGLHHSQLSRRAGGFHLRARPSSSRTPPIPAGVTPTRNMRATGRRSTR